MKKAHLIFSLALLAAACARPPTKEIADAENAVNAATQAGAGDYAADQMRAAQDALTNANTQLDAKDYKGAKASALEAKTKAAEAQAAIEAGKNMAKGEAEVKVKALLTETTWVVTESAKSKLKSAPTLKKEAAMLQSEAEALQAEYEAGNYRTVLNKADPLLNRVSGFKTTVEASLKPAKAPVKTGRPRRSK